MPWTWWMLKMDDDDGLQWWMLGKVLEVYPI
jgi:hypothetical protein